jgi:selenide,water dikinase
VLQPIRDIFDTDDYPDLLVGLQAADDAAVYRLSDSLAIVTTTDFFPPVVDDPYDFGAIAAANALSDVYAMGGRPLFAINLVAFPSGLDRDYLRALLRGGAEKVAEAGAVIAGGHSVTDKEPKYGLAVTGSVDPRQLKKKGGSRPGDALLLTKPLGTGVITTALKNQNARENDVKAAIISMKTLNRQAADAAQISGVKSMTDITGFGLLGHAHEMAHMGNVNFRIFSQRLSWLPGALSYGEGGNFPGGMANNLDFFSRWVAFDQAVGHLIQDMLWTPETSGGLFVAVDPTQVANFMAACPSAVIIGEVLDGDGHIEVVHSDS